MTMNLDELRDAHAKRLGWDYCPLVYDGSWHKDGKYCKHPVPSTLDAIAGLMPPNWKWRRGYQVWVVTKIAAAPMLGLEFDIPDTGDELTDRARLAWLAWEAEAKGAGQ